MNRVATSLENPDLLYPLYCLLFTMPGVPSIYYGSEWGLEGQRTNTDDRPLRPDLDLSQLQRISPQTELPAVIARLASIRLDSFALRHGDYKELLVASEQLVFSRNTDHETVIVFLNTAKETSFDIPLSLASGTRFTDLLNPPDEFHVTNNHLHIGGLRDNWARILQAKN